MNEHVPPPYTDFEDLSRDEKRRRISDALSYAQQLGTQCMSPHELRKLAELRAVLENSGKPAH